MKKLLLILFILAGAVAVAQVPYNVNKKKFPLGDDFRKLMPQKVGDWERFAFHDFIPDREEGSVYYQNGKKEIHLNFGKAQSQADMKMIWGKLYTDLTEGKEQQIKQKNTTSTTTKFLVMQDKKYLFAWTRNLYYFSVNTKDKADADDFMKSFPW